MAIDFSSDVGRVRLRIGDINDLPFLPDEVYFTAIQENNGNLSRASQLCAQYLLAMFAIGASHKKMVQLEVWNKERFDAYRQFLLDTVTNPAFIGGVYPIPYGVSSDDANDPVKQFICDWNNNWNTFTVDENMNMTAWS
jgi:hypothetical protein